MLEKVLCRRSGAPVVDSARENAAANLLVLVVTFFEGFRTKARISFITLVFSFFSGAAVLEPADPGVVDPAATPPVGDFWKEVDIGPVGASGFSGLRSEPLCESIDFCTMSYVSDGFEMVIGGILVWVVGLVRAERSP